MGSYWPPGSKKWLNRRNIENRWGWCPWVELSVSVFLTRIAAFRYLTGDYARSVLLPSWWWSASVWKDAVSLITLQVIPNMSSQYEDITRRANMLYGNDEGVTLGLQEELPERPRNISVNVQKRTPADLLDRQAESPTLMPRRVHRLTNIPPSLI